MDPKTARAAKRIKIMRVVQSTLSAMLSLAIAIFQARVYATYQNTRSQEGMWPAVPNVMPTILLFSVAIAALVFDGCSESRVPCPSPFTAVGWRCWFYPSGWLPRRPHPSPTPPPYVPIYS